MLMGNEDQKVAFGAEEQPKVIMLHRCLVRLLLEVIDIMRMASGMMIQMI